MAQRKYRPKCGVKFAEIAVKYSEKPKRFFFNMYLKWSDLEQVSDQLKVCSKNMKKYVEGKQRAVEFRENEFYSL